MNSYWLCRPLSTLYHQRHHHNSETDEAIWIWFHPLWKPPKRPVIYQGICVFNITTNYITHKLVWEGCWDTYGRKSLMLYTSVLVNAASYWVCVWNEDNWVWWRQHHTYYKLQNIIIHGDWLLIIVQYLVIYQCIIGSLLSCSIWFNINV